MKIAPLDIPGIVMPLQDGLRAEEVDVDDEVLTLTLTAIAPTACCPVCATPSAHLHSHYRRHAAALPWGSLTVRLRLGVRRFRCGTSDSPRRIFTERSPTFWIPARDARLARRSWCAPLRSRWAAKPGRASARSSACR